MVFSGARRFGLLLLLAALALALVAARPARAAQDSWGRAWGKGVNGGSAFGICTVAASCQVGSTGGLGGEMSGPQGVATDAAGNVYVADTGNNRIQEFDSSGNWLRAFGGGMGGSGVDICTLAVSCQAGSTGGLGGEINFPEGVGTDAAGNVYVADSGNNRIQEFDSSGNWLRAFGADVGGSGVDICTVAASCQAGSSGGLGGEMSNPVRGRHRRSGQRLRRRLLQRPDPEVRLQRELACRLGQGGQWKQRMWYLHCRHQLPDRFQRWSGRRDEQPPWRRHRRGGQRLRRGT